MLEEAGYSVSDSTRAQDRREASDLMITVADDTLSDTQQACTQQGCALRIRSEKALQFWPDDFTFRALRPQCGDDTEFRKIMEGHARYALYGFTDHVDAIVLMRMLDLDILRTSILSDPDRYDRPVIQGQYGVGYLVFNIHEFPEHFVRETWDFRH
jgi:hypothetical protein